MPVFLSNNETRLVRGDVEDMSEHYQYKMALSIKQKLRALQKDLDLLSQHPDFSELVADLGKESGFETDVEL